MASGLRVVPWFNTAEDYDAVRRVMPNLETLSSSFDEWQKGALELIEKMEKADIVVRQVVIDPVKLASWRLNCGIDDDEIAFGQFVAAAYGHNALGGD